LESTGNQTQGTETTAKTSNNTGADGSSGSDKDSEGKGSSSKDATAADDKDQNTETTPTTSNTQDDSAASKGKQDGKTDSDASASDRGTSDTKSARSTQESGSASDGSKNANDKSIAQEVSDKATEVKKSLQDTIGDNKAQKEGEGQEQDEDEGEGEDNDGDDDSDTDDSPKKSSSSLGWLVLALLGACFYVLHLFVSAPIRPGHIVTPGMWLSRCGIIPYKCEAAYLHVRPDGAVILYNDKHEAAWEIPGKQCPKDRESDCVPGLHVLEDDSLEIGGSKVNTMYVFHNGEPMLTPWPFLEKPKIKRVQRKYKLTD
jgi:hypothetical protein